MSGSFDRRDRSPPRPPGPYGAYGVRGGQPQTDQLPSGYDGFYDDAVDPQARNVRDEFDPRTASSAEPPAFYDDRTALTAPPPSEDLFAEARRPPRDPASAAIVPPGSVTGRSLTVVIAIMCFLACLTAGTVYMINRSADLWLKDMAAEITVQVEPREGADTERTVTDVAAQLTRTPGILAVRPLSLQESTALLEPWLGQAEVLKTLPVPRLIAIEIDPSTPPDIEVLKQRLAASYKGVSVDDHRQWQQQIRTVTRSLALGGFMILFLVAAATIAIIVSATRSAMASNSDIVEVLHFVGATDRFIAREFDKHFLKLGVKAGLVGALSAAVVFLTAPTVVSMIGGQGVTTAELQRLVGSGSLDLLGYGMLVAVVFVIAALCMITSRLGVFNILNTRV